MKKTRKIKKITPDMTGILLSIIIVSVLFFLQTAPATAESKIVEATGYGHDRGAALRDAFRQAIELGLGIEIKAETECERFRLVKDIVFTRSSGFVENYTITYENPTTSLGYEIRIKATVSQGKISNMDNLRSMIELMGNPPIALYVEPSIDGYVDGIDLLKDNLSKDLNEAGYNVIADQGHLEGNLDIALGHAADNGADVIIMGKVHSIIKERHATKYGELVNARSKFTAQVVNVESGEVVYNIDTPEGKGTASSPEGAIKKAIESFTKAVSDDLLWNMAGKIGPPYLVDISVSGIECGDADNIISKLMQLSEIENMTFKKCFDNTGQYKARITCKTMELAKSLKDLPNPEYSIIGVSRGKLDLTRQ